MHRATALFFVVAMVVSGCGDSGGTVSAPGVSTSQTDAATSSTQSDASLPTSVGSGHVELDGTRYEFTATTACARFQGAVNVIGSLDEGDGGVEAFIPPEDWESDEQQATFAWSPPYVRIEIGDVRWRADPINAEGSSVTAFRNDGFTVTGEADFDSTDGQRATGTFAFSCP